MHIPRVYMHACIVHVIIIIIVHYMRAWYMFHVTWGDLGHLTCMYACMWHAYVQHSCHVQCMLCILHVKQSCILHVIDCGLHAGTGMPHVTCIIIRACHTHTTCMPLARYMPHACVYFYSCTKQNASHKLATRYNVIIINNNNSCIIIMSLK